jgi:hypothetical protein
MAPPFSFRCIALPEIPPKVKNSTYLESGQIQDNAILVRHECERVCKPIEARNWVRDEGRPLGADLQERASNRLKLLWSRAMVVSVEQKSRQGSWQVWIKEMSESEPSDEVSKH